MEMIEIPHLLNFRDFSACHRKDNTLLPANVFARSDNPAFLDEKEIAALKKRGLTTIVDLRRHHECAVRPDYLVGRPGFCHHHIVMNEEPYLSFNRSVEPADIAAAYYSKLSVSAQGIAAVFRIFAAAKDGVLFHCESGKDRTGTIAILLLLLHDIMDEDIAEDYRLSYDRMYDNDHPALLADPTLIPMKETVSCFLQLFRRDFLCCDDYFLSIGLTAEELTGIRMKYGE
ncbi:MAG TPA: tyrosine-protein phosphatase [Clostridiales bacterium]|nr:tyrosine-protein phosphatase [Clostridiales bacterium]